MSNSNLLYNVVLTILAIAVVGLANYTFNLKSYTLSTLDNHTTAINKIKDNQSDIVELLDIIADKIVDLKEQRGKQ